MEIPIELRRMPPQSTLDWVASRVRTDRAGGGECTGCATPGPRRCTRSTSTTARADAGNWSCGGGSGPTLHLIPASVENESSALRLLESSAAAAVVAPTLVVADADAVSADVPTLVMTRLAGHDALAPIDLDGYLDGLVATLHAIHAVPVPADVELETYRPWGLEHLTEPPPWTREPAVWQRAISRSRTDRCRSTKPCSAIATTTPATCSGTTVGCRASSIGRMRVAAPRPPTSRTAAPNLTLLFGLEVADEFARRYGPVNDLAWFDLLTQVGFGELSTWRWHDAGRFDIDEAALIRAGDALLVSAVERLG